MTRDIPLLSVDKCARKYPRQRCRSGEPTVNLALTNNIEHKVVHNFLSGWDMLFACSQMFGLYQSQHSLKFSLPKKEGGCF